jgi:hypothetical protein
MTDKKDTSQAPPGRSRKKAEELSAAHKDDARSAALRANLAKRKQQARARKDTATKTTTAEEQD